MDRTMSGVVPGLVEDLRAEHEELSMLLTGKPDSVWSVATPAPRWTVHDQIAHLAHFDEIARLCIAAPEEFERFSDGLDDLQTYVDSIGERYRDRSGAEMLAWWSEESDRLRVAALAADPTVRVPWFGPTMSVASKITARIMETWAHGQDIFDALGVERQPSARLRHIARIGVLAFPNSFRVRGLEVPEGSVSVCLSDPEGGPAWTWGDESAGDSVVGTALDFCFVVTQRRNVADTSLEVAGDLARRWMEVAQAFAGSPGEGRQPGQHGVRKVPS